MIDEEGYLHYVGRNKEMIKGNGMIVFPFEIEDLLGRHEVVAGSAVVARADIEKGQFPVAFVELKLGETVAAAELRVCPKDRIASFKVPEIRIIDMLHITNLGKPKKQQLADEPAAEVLK